MKYSGGSGRAWLIALFGAVAALALWLRGEPLPPEPARSSNVRSEPSQRAATHRPAPVAPLLAAPASDRKPTAVAARATQADPDLEHPHPITDAHRRIFEENNRLGTLNGAVDQRDVAAIRRLNARYRKDYPEDDHALQDGYDLIADCLERRTPDVIERARHFWNTRRASALRRYVRRYCLEEPRG